MLGPLFQVVGTPTQLPENGLIAINSWGYGGCFGHCVLQRFSKPALPPVIPIPRLVPIAARSEEFAANAILTVSSYQSHKYLGEVEHILLSTSAHLVVKRLAKQMS